MTFTSQPVTIYHRINQDQSEDWSFFINKNIIGI